MKRILTIKIGRMTAMTIGMLKRILRIWWMTMMMMSTRQMVRESKQRLEAQRQEYEGAISRHQVA